MRDIYNEIKGIAEQFPNEPELREYQVNIAVNLSIDYMNKKQIADATDIYREISTIAKNYPNLLAIQREQGRILVLLIFHYTEETDDIKSARELYHRLAQLAVAHPEETFFRRAQADAAVSIIAKIDEMEEED